MALVAHRSVLQGSVGSALVSDAVPPSEPVPPSPDAVPHGPDAPDAPEVDLDVRAFLPEGVVLGEPGEAEPDVADEPDAADAADAAAPDLAALDQVQADLDAVDAAIDALDAGTYGIDPATGQPFDDELLAADPTRLR